MPLTLWRGCYIDTDEAEQQRCLAESARIDRAVQAAAVRADKDLNAARQ
jgi:hypothetical protein